MVKVGVIGCGYWGSNLIRNVLQCDKMKLKWVCDTDPDSIEKLEWLIPKSVDMYSSPDLRDFLEFIRHTYVDAVIIATPAQTHYKTAMAALNAGMHVLVEKPLTTSYMGGRGLIELAISKNLVLQVDHTYIYHNAVRKIKEIIDSGELGDILYYDSVRVNLGLFHSDVNIIWDLAPHDFSIINFLFDCEPYTSIKAEKMTHTGDTANMAYVTIRYEESPFIAHIHLNWLSPVKIRKTIIGGSDKMLVWEDTNLIEPIRIYNNGIDVDEEDKNNILISYRTGDVWSPKVDDREALANMIDDFVKAIESKSKLVDPISLKVLAMLEDADG